MLVRYTPFGDVARVQALVDRLFDSTAKVDAPLGGAWSPAFDVIESEDKIVLQADLPGLHDNEVDIQVAEGVLTVKGERKIERTEAKNQYRRYERVAGAFARSFRLPPTIETGSILANLKDGVLTLTLPKRTEAQPRQIKVSVAH